MVGRPHGKWASMVDLPVGLSPGSLLQPGEEAESSEEGGFSEGRGLQVLGAPLWISGGGRGFACLSVSVWSF